MPKPKSEYLLVTPDLLYFGLTQKTAPLAIREKLRTDRETQLALLSHLSRLCDGQIVLATCERFEVYASAQPGSKAGLTSFLMQWFGLSAEQFSRYARTLVGPHAAGHFLRVAAGLESRIVGERQILGQVRNAHQMAIEQSALDAQLSLLARTAIRTGKRARNETTLDCDSRSIVTLAMDWLTDENEDISDKRVAIVGSGRLAALVASQVAQRRPAQMMITGRNHFRAALLAKHFDGHHAELSELRRTISQSDVVIACTASLSYLVDANMIDANRGTPLRLVDLCVPRNVDPAVELIPGVRLTHLDDMFARELSPSRRAASGPARDAVMQVEDIVQQELNVFLQWRRERQAVPLIADLLSRAASSTSAVGKRALHEQIMRLKSGVVV